MQLRRVFVTGGTGFVGRAVIRALRAEGYVVRCLVRRGSEGDLQGLGAIERVEGDVLSRQSLNDAITGCDAAVHLVGIIREHPSTGQTFEHVHVRGTLNVLEAAAHAGIKRYLHMSALGTRLGARSRYHQTKWAAEEAVRYSALPWTIFRPSIIYGRGDELVTLLADIIGRYGVVPVIGSGHQRVQPVPVEHVALGFVRALGKSAATKQTYEVVGPDAVTMVRLLDLIGEAQGRRHVRKIHAPLGLVRPLTTLLQRLPSFPLTPDQVLMLEEDNTGDPAPFYASFAIPPLPLERGLREMLQ